jgi:hypothetical protein
VFGHPGDGTGPVTLDQRGPQRRRDGPLARRHRLDVGAVADDELEQGIAEEVPGDGDRDGADAVDLAPLVAFDRAAPQRGQVDAEVDVGLRFAIIAAGCDTKGGGHRPPAPGPAEEGWGGLEGDH